MGHYLQALGGVVAGYGDPGRLGSEGRAERELLEIAIRAAFSVDLRSKLG